MISISIVDIVGALVTLFLALRFLFALIHAYKKLFKRQDSVEFSDVDFYFVMIGSGYVTIMLIAILYGVLTE